MDLIIVRHGRPERVVGLDEDADPGLTDVGHRQACAVAKFLMGEHIDHIVTSPMQRARQTAQPLVDETGINAEVIDGLAEIDQGSTSYIPLEVLKAEGGAAWQAIVDNPATIHGETNIEDFADIVTAVFERIIADHAGETVVAFCHAMVTMQFLRRILRYPDVHALRIDYASITRIQAATSKPIRSVRSVNETGHLGETLILSP